MLSSWIMDLEMLFLIYAYCGSILWEFCLEENFEIVYSFQNEPPHL
jgi:hypothetical protein